MENEEQFLALFQDAMGSVKEPRFYATERGYQGELLAQLRNKIADLHLPGGPIIEQEYQKTIPNHGLDIRPDVIVHIPFERGNVKARDQGNFVAIELKLRATENEARGDLAKLVQMREILGYPLTIFINIDSEETHAKLCPPQIGGQTVCYAVRLGDGNPEIRSSGPAV